LKLKTGVKIFKAHIQLLIMSQFVELKDVLFEAKEQNELIIISIGEIDFAGFITKIKDNLIVIKSEYREIYNKEKEKQLGITYDYIYQVYLLNDYYIPESAINALINSSHRFYI